MRLVFRPEARRELLDAQAWYKESSPGLGFEFARAVDAAIARALRMPLAFPRIEAEFRHVMRASSHTQLFIVQQGRSWSWCPAFIIGASQVLG